MAGSSRRLRVLFAYALSVGGALLALSPPAVVAQESAEGSAQTTGPVLAEAREVDAGRVTGRMEPVDPERPRVGEPFRATLHLELPETWRVQGIVGGTGPYVEFVDAQPAEAGSDRAWTTRWVVYRPGRFRTTARVTVVTDDGDLTIVEAVPFDVEIRSSIANETSPERAPDDPPVPVRIPDQRPLWAAAAVAFVLFGAFVGWALRRRAAMMQPAPPPPPPRPADEVALERLLALQAAGMLERGEHVAFHTELSEILREFLGSSLGFPALESTTVEIQRELDVRLEEVGERIVPIIELLQDTDFVKFARYAPEPAFSRECLSRTLHLIEELTPAREARSEPEDVPPPLEDAPPPVPPSEERP